MELSLARFAYTPENTQALLTAGGWSCFTIAQPWRRWSYPGGEPFKSCIPEGTYDLLPFKRSNGDRAFAIVNEHLGVYFAESDMPKDSNGQRLGRFACLIHGRASYVGDVQGCEAVGEKRIIDPDRRELMVTNSTATMAELVNVIGWDHGHTLRIFHAPGAVDTPLVTI